MVTIISDEQFKSRYLSIKERYFSVLEISEKNFNNEREEKKRNYKNLSDIIDESEKNRFKKVKRILERMKSAKERQKMYAIKCLNSLEKYQMLFQNEERAVIVQMVELMEKVILHKKLNREY